MRTDQVDSLGILHDHYKDTFTYQRETIKLRDRLFVLLLLALTLMSFQVAEPGQYAMLTYQLIQQKAGAKISINPHFLNSMLWFGLLSLYVRYAQTVIQIERQYDYLNRLENKIKATPGLGVFEREGAGYLNEHPAVLSLIYWFYTIVFPAGLFMVTLLKVVSEYPTDLAVWPYYCMDLVIFFFLIVVLAMNFWYVHKRQ